MEELAVELQGWEEEQSELDDADPYPEYLPALLTYELDQVINLLIQQDRYDLDPEAFLSQIADLLNQRADQLFQEDRTIELIFDRNEYWYLDQMLEKENANRSKKQQFPDLKSLVLFLMRERLIENGTGFWGVTDEGMVKLGEKLQKFTIKK